MSPSSFTIAIFVPTSLFSKALRVMFCANAVLSPSIFTVSILSAGSAESEMFGFKPHPLALSKGRRYRLQTVPRVVIQAEEDANAKEDLRERLRAVDCGDDACASDDDAESWDCWSEALWNMFGS